MQIRFSLYMVGFGVVIIASILTYFLMTMGQMLDQLTLIYNIDKEVLSGFGSSIKFVGIIVSILTVIFSGISIVLSIILSHRVVGPMIPIKRQIQNLLEGNYQARGHLRKYDEFQDIMTGLNELADQLDKKKPKSS